MKACKALKYLFFLLLIIRINALNAQLCNGSLGDPAVDITFGSGSGSTNYVPTNSYTYTSSQCPTDGYYTITTSTSGCFGNTWHTVTQDHTGNGAFMLVNASFEPSDFFLTTVTNLCPNTTYEFAAWVMNVLNKYGIRPNITFSIETQDGSVLNKYSTGDIVETAEPEWIQYGLFFTTPVNNATIVLRMTNNAPGGLGNDLALDDITFRACGPSITAMIQGNDDTVNICTGNTTDFTFQGDASADFKMPVYQWQLSTNGGIAWQDIPGADSQSYLRTPEKPGSYSYRLAVTEKSSAGLLACRTASNAVAINVHDTPAVNAGSDRILIKGYPITIQGMVTGDNPLYYWNPATYLDNDSVLMPKASPPASITYTLYAISAFGCKSNDAMQIKVVNGIYVPNAFTPNGDGKNDRWEIPYLDPSLNASVNLYNRFGQVIYHATGTTVSWDGTFKGIPQSAGTYIYSIQFKSIYPEIKGTVLLIR